MSALTDMDSTIERRPITSRAEWSHRFRDLAGQRFGSLLIGELIGQAKDKHALWRCRCDCGGLIIVQQNNLVSGNTKSCSRCDEKIGVRFGRLTIIGFDWLQESKRRRRAAICKCDCGSEVRTDLAKLRQKRPRSCVACSRKAQIAWTRHGDSRIGARAAEYKCWGHMLQRCDNPKDKRFTDYGGRGITVCERWRLYENFFADMGRKPSPKHSIDRIEVNGNYEPSNCRWATAKEQRANQRRCVQ
jgi:hypothetical protein